MPPDAAAKPPAQTPTERPRGRRGGSNKLTIAAVPVWKDALYEHLARLVLTNHTTTEMARATGYSVVAVVSILKRPDFLPVYERVKERLYSSIDEAIYDQRRTIAERTDAAAPRAFTEIVRLCEGARSDYVRFQAAQHLLGLAGHTPIQRKISAQVPVADLDDTSIDKLGSAFAAAMRRDSVEVVDVEATETPAEAPDDAQKTQTSSE